jgi:hypothetical protein
MSSTSSGSLSTRAQHPAEAAPRSPPTADRHADERTPPSTSPRRHGQAAEGPGPTGPSPTPGPGPARTGPGRLQARRHGSPRPARGGPGRPPTRSPATHAPQPQHGRRGQVTRGDLQRGWEGADEIGSQPVGEAALVSCGAFVVAGDGAQLPGQLAVGDQRAQRGMAIQGQQATDAGVLGVVLLAGGPRRRATKSGLTGSTV